MPHRQVRVESLRQARALMKKINVSTQGIEVMAPKAMGSVVLLEKVRLGAANILKQEMLSIGGDAAVARGVVEGSVTHSDVVLLGNRDKIAKLVRKLQYQNIFGLPQIRAFLHDIVLDNPEEPAFLDCRGVPLVVDEPQLMGILNCTPDSFSDGGQFRNADDAVAYAGTMLRESAAIIDVGGESTRPGSKPVSETEELSRVIPVVTGIREHYPDALISVDTTRASVARKALTLGAHLINDISALQADTGMIELLRENRDVPVVLMHMNGIPETMQDGPWYSDCVDEVLVFLEKRLDFCLKSGLAEDQLLIDPGIGFGKRLDDNLSILRRLDEFLCFGRPVVLGASRKRWIAGVYASEPEERLSGSLAAAAAGFRAGVALIRVHDVREHRRFLDSLTAIRNAP